MSNDLRNAFILFEDGRITKSIELSKKIIKKDKMNVAANYNLSRCYFQKNELKASIYHAELAAKSKVLETLHYYGTLLLKLGKIEEAVKVLHDAKNYPTAYNDLAYALRLLGDFEGAKQVIEEKIQSNPNNSKYYLSLSQHYRQVGNIEKAIHFCKKSIEIDESADALVDLSMFYIITEQWEEGWKLFENRWKIIPHARKTFGQIAPFWNGEDLNNKHIVLFCEQGYGDLFQFLRYIPYLKDKYPNVKLSIALKSEHSSVMSFLSSHLDVEVRDNLVLKPNYICSFLSLPFVLGQKSPKEIPPLLVINPKKMELASNKFKIGLAYFGDATHPHDQFRSMSIKNFDFLQTPDTELFDLTKERSVRNHYGFGNVKLWEGLNVSRKNLNNWSDTASLVAAMDLVICVDTGVCHLAGIMNKKTFLLLPFAPDWRWGFGDNWWYNNMTLFRQTKFNSWEEPLQLLRKTIGGCINKT